MLVGLFDGGGIIFVDFRLWVFIGLLIGWSSRKIVGYENWCGELLYWSVVYVDIMFNVGVWFGFN